MSGLDNNPNLLQIILKFLDRIAHISLKFIFIGYGHLVDFGGLRFNRRPGRDYRLSGIKSGLLGGRRVNSFHFRRAYSRIYFGERIFKIADNIKQVIGPVIVYFFQLFIRIFNDLNFFLVFYFLKVNFKSFSFFQNGFLGIGSYFLYFFISFFFYFLEIVLFFFLLFFYFAFLFIGGKSGSRSDVFDFTAEFFSLLFNIFSSLRSDVFRGTPCLNFDIFNLLFGIFSYFCLWETA